MERLTKKINGEACHYDCRGTCGTCDGCECFEIGAMVDKLAAYEDTGLEPEEINRRISIQNWDKALQKQNAVDLEKLLEYMYAEEQWQLVVLPCKVGDTTYCITNEGIKALDIMAVASMTDKYDTYFEGYVKVKGYLTPERIGDTLFLTREEAEAALERSKHD